MILIPGRVCTQNVFVVRYWEDCIISKIDEDRRNGHGYAEKNGQIGNDISCLDDEESNSTYDADGRGWASTADACYFASLPVLHFIQFFIC